MNFFLPGFILDGLARLSDVANAIPKANPAPPRKDLTPAQSQLPLETDAFKNNIPSETQTPTTKTRRTPEELRRILKVYSNGPKPDETTTAPKNSPAPAQNLEPQPPAFHSSDVLAIMTDYSDVMDSLNVIHFAIDSYVSIPASQKIQKGIFILEKLNWCTKYFADKLNIIKNHYQSTPSKNHYDSLSLYSKHTESGLLFTIECVFENLRNEQFLCDIEQQKIYLNLIENISENLNSIVFASQSITLAEKIGEIELELLDPVKRQLFQSVIE